MINEKFGGGAESKTPTNVNSNLSMRNTSLVRRSGNVVDFRILFDVSTTFTPGETTKLCEMPYSAVGNTYFYMERGVGPFNNATLGHCSLRNKNLEFGSGPYPQLTAGTLIWVSGTYLTEG